MHKFAYKGLRWPLTGSSAQSKDPHWLSAFVPDYVRSINNWKRAKYSLAPSQSVGCALMAGISNAECVTVLLIRLLALVFPANKLTFQLLQLHSLNILRNASSVCLLMGVSLTRGLAWIYKWGQWQRGSPGVSLVTLSVYRVTHANGTELVDKITNNEPSHSWFREEVCWHSSWVAIIFYINVQLNWRAYFCSRASSNRILWML